MMMKKVWFGIALLSVALWTGCATGGGGHTGGGITVKVTAALGQDRVGVTLTVQFTATVDKTDNKAVTWTLTQNGAACSACGTLSASGLYTAPSTPPTPPTVDITATSVANPNSSGTANLKVVPITVTVTPGPATITLGLQQQFAAPVTPDLAPQTVTWSITDCPTGPCGSVDANGLYTAPNSIPASVSVLATSTIDPPNWTGKTKITLVNSRLTGTYAFKVSGFDGSNNPIAAAGNFVANDDGTIQGGTSASLLTASVSAHCTILNTSTYVQDGNNHGTLSLRTSGPGACTSPALRKYNFVLDANGDGRLIQTDASGRAAGAIMQSATVKNGAFAGTFAFGFTGSDLGGKRVGYVGVFQADGANGINASGSIDVNDNGTATASSGFDTNLSQYNISADGSGTLTLVSNGTTYNFAMYVVGGKTQNDQTPLTVFAISNDGPTNHSAVGTIVFQDPTPKYDKSSLNDFAVTNLTGVDGSGSHTQVSLTSSIGDGNGNISATYDANNAGTPVVSTAFNSTYAATGLGRYTVDWLSPAVHFVLYLSAANRGFMLDQSSSAVYAGTMDPQPGSAFATSAMPGTFEAASVDPGTSGVNPIAMNLFMSIDTTSSFKVAGTQDQTGSPAGQTIAGEGTFDLNNSTFTIPLTLPTATTKYVVYPIDDPKPGFLVQHFEMIDVDPANKNPSIIFGER